MGIQLKTFTLKRQAETPKSTWGFLNDDAGTRLCVVLERGAHNPDHPRVVAGTYGLSLRPFGSSKFDVDLLKQIGAAYKGVLLLDTSAIGRSLIEIHPANWQWDLRGCLAPGESVTRDGYNDFMVTASRKAYPKAYLPMAAAIADGGAELTIVDAPV